jgi:hypothetical protein
MSLAAVDVRRIAPALVFDLEDRYARDRAARGPHPRPVGPVRIFLAGKVVLGVRQDFPVPYELVTTRNSSGYHIFFGEDRPARGGRRRMGLADGTYVVRVESDFYQAVEREDVVLPSPAITVPTLFDLEPGPAYPFPTESTLGRSRGPTLLRGTVRRRDGRGIEGALVEVPTKSNRCRTGADGQWVLVFEDTQPAGNVTVRFRFPAVVDIPNVPLVPGRSNSLPETALRGRVLAAGGVPAAGARVRVTGDPAEAVTAVDGGWTYAFPPDQTAALVNVTAELPGSSLTQSGVQVNPRSTVVVPTFRFP